jgi:hypothetical protein
MRFLFAIFMIALVSSLACEPAPSDDIVQNPPVDTAPVVVQTPPAVETPPVVNSPPVDQVVLNPPTTGDQNNLPGQGPIDSGIPIDDGGGDEAIN